MPDFCQNPNGPFDGSKLTTARDRQLCREAGGSILSRPDETEGGPGGCASAPVESFALASGDRIDVNPLYAARAFFGSSREISLLLRLSERAAPVVESILLEDPELAGKLVAGLERLSKIAKRALDEEFSGPPYTAADHTALSRLASAVAQRTEDAELDELVQEATRIGESLQGKEAAAFRRRFGRLPRPPMGPSQATDFEVAVPPSGIDPGVLRPRGWHLFQPSQPIEGTWKELPAAVIAAEITEAHEKIGEKAAALGWAKTPRGGVKRLYDGAYVQRFAECDIYYSLATGAHEVHGDIRAKYDLVNGPFLLGLPTTDESPCGDGRGVFNHFAYDASIYWTDTTGPFYLRGPVRFRWASEGWQASWLGYPVRDEERMPGIVPGVDPDMRWTVFENGIVFGQAGEGRTAVHPDFVPAQQIANAVRNAFDARLPRVQFQVGVIPLEIRPGLFGAEVLGVDEWQYGFLGATPRTLRIRIRGFISVPVASDPTFELDLGLRFETAWPVQSNFLYPATKTIAARLVSLRVAVDGVASGEFAPLLLDAVKGAFRPDPATNPELVDGQLAFATVATGARQGPTAAEVNLDFLDVLILADGSLGFYMNPLPPHVGLGRLIAAKQALAEMLPPE